MISIEDVIQHRSPALCIDEIVECGESEVLCALTVRDGPLVQSGHLWEPALLEAVAQTAAVMGGFRVKQLGLAVERGWLVGARGFVIQHVPVVGQRVMFHVRTIRRLDQFILVEATVSCCEAILATGQLKFYEALAK